MDLLLRKTTIEDLDTLFENQLDEQANQMAAFTPKDPSDREAYMTKWTKIVGREDINMQTVELEGKITGSVLHFNMGDETHVSYWFGREYWGKGIATKALKQFIESTPKRPLFAFVAFDNLGSQKVLERNNFKRIGKEKGFANARGKEIEEFVYKFE